MLVRYWPALAVAGGRRGCTAAYADGGWAHTLAAAAGEWWGDTGGDGVLTDGGGGMGWCWCEWVIQLTQSCVAWKLYRGDQSRSLVLPFI